ncbi:MAG: hypothetical protein WKF47_09695 [Geodermatophilaceae bacterium]
MSRAQTSSRLRGLGVPGSARRQTVPSSDPTETLAVTGTTVAASLSNGRSRRINEPFVKIENGVAKSRSAVMMPGISR